MDEGDLHAYLDGELEHVEPGASGEVEAHLARCALCRGRLTAAQAVRLGARDVLRAGGGEGVAPPAFEAIAARAAGRAALPSLRSADHRRAMHRRAVTLGWAASLVAAMGAGWFAREASFRQDEPASYAVREMQAVETARQPVPAPTAAASASAVDAAPLPAGRQPGDLSAEQFASLFQALPEPEALATGAARAAENVQRWSQENPELARARPAAQILEWLRSELDPPADAGGG